MAGNLVLQWGVTSVRCERRMNMERSQRGRGGEEGRVRRRKRGRVKTKHLDESFSCETEISCVYFHLSSITPRTLLAKKLPVN